MSRLIAPMDSGRMRTNNLAKKCSAHWRRALGSQGFGLVEVLIAAGIGSVIMMGMSSMMTSMNLSVRGTRTMASRDELKTRIAREAGNPQALKTSITFSDTTTYPGFAIGAGSNLDKCANGTTPNGCVAIVSGAQQSYGFTLTDTFAVPIAGPDTAHAAVFDINGAFCGNNSVKPANTNCPILVTASFKPTCPNFQNQCDRASSIDVQYTITQASGVTLNGGPMLQDFSDVVSTSIPFVGAATGVANMLAKWSSTTQLTASSIVEEASSVQPSVMSVGIGEIGASGPWGRFDVEETRNETTNPGYQIATVTVGQKASVASDSAANNVAGLFSVRSDGSSNHNFTTGMNALVGHAKWWESSATLSFGHGVSGVTRNQNTGVIDTAIGTDGTTSNESTGTINKAVGLNGRVLNYTSTGTINTAYGGWFQIQPAATGVSGYKKIDNGYGVYIDVMDATNKWAVYSIDSGAASYLAGSVTIGPTGGINSAAARLYVGADSGTGRSINMAGTMNASGADFAEWVEWRDGPKPEMGSVILYKGSYVVVSSEKNAAYIGNDKRDLSRSILVAFAGQLPVLIKGPVHVGDLVIGASDGTARAVAKKDATLEMAQRAVGSAWEASEDPGIKRVNVAVGIGMSGGGTRDLAALKELRHENAALSKELSDLKSRLSQIENSLSIH